MFEQALAELREAFPGVTWEQVTEADIDWPVIVGGGVVLEDCGDMYTDGQWQAATDGDIDSAIRADSPVAAVRAWLAAQPTAAFYSEAPGGKTVEARGFVSVNTRRETVVCDSEAGARAYLDDVVAVYPIVIRVPVPVDPPVLVGEVSDV